MNENGDREDGKETFGVVGGENGGFLSSFTEISRYYVVNRKRIWFTI